ncbi:MAG: hypothetical protein HQ504_07885 [Rhodospirillaceae bacterium]|nr:hypothetical protein [Rhodospirillaceae bacterium]
MTKDLREVGDILGIQIHDHIVASKSANISFNTLGVL